MRKIKIFLSLKKEENWINSVQKDGYKLVSVNYCLPIYKFNKLEQSETFIPYVRLDCTDEYMKRNKYEDYVNLFYDNGWKLIKGCRYGGTQYFQQISSNTTSGIFSDENSRKRYFKYSYSYGFIFLLYFFIFFPSQHDNSISLFNFKSWYSPNLWQAKGEWFWKTFMFETPYVLLQLVPLYLCLFLGTYYLMRALINKDTK